MKMTKAEILKQNYKLQEQNKRLEEQLFSERNAKGNCAEPGNAFAASSTLMGAGQCANPARISAAPSKPSIGESANRIHDRIDKAHALIDVLGDRLTSIRQVSPANASGLAGATPAPCPHIGSLDAARERIEIGCVKLQEILDSLMI